MARDTYAGNPLLKGAYQPLEYDKETIEEFLRCSKDPVHFARTYITCSNASTIHQIVLTGFQVYTIF